jgi:predicted metal-dependent phosphoesterase TrpH
VQVARAIQSAGDVPTCLAEEISTSDGEVIGIFLSEEIRPRLSAAETVDRIHDQGGLVLIPHPFCRYRPHVIPAAVLEELIEKIDIIEVWNARTPVEDDNAKAAAFAEQWAKPVTVGSDAHTPRELGKTFMEMPRFGSPAEFLESLRAATVSCREVPSETRRRIGGLFEKAKGRSR